MKDVIYDEEARMALSRIRRIRQHYNIIKQAGKEVKKNEE